MKRALSFFLVGVLAVSLFPWAHAAQPSTASLNVFSQTSSTLAPGVTQDVVFAKMKDGQQLEYYVAIADTTRDDVTLNVTYKNAQWAEWGLSPIPDQMAAAEQAHSDPTSDRYIPNYTPVAGVNGAYYNMSTGQPEGAFAMEGHIIQDAGSKPFFAILKDGTPVIGFTAAEWNALKANTSNPIWEAVSGHTVQVKNGQNVATTDPTLYPRTSVGITADNKVVLVTADGWNAPTSVGATMSQMAEIMLANGCVNALELDGGGSATYVARQEGSDQLSVVNTPSDGSARNTSNGLMIVSTTPPSDVFDRAQLTPENEYVTPGSTVAVDAKGVSPAGTSAEVPAGVSWQVADPTLGSVAADGTFTSSGKTGDAMVQMVYGGKVVGETAIHVVEPDSLAFSQSTITVPFGETVPLRLTAMYGLNEVAMKDGDVAFTLTDPSAGTVSGFHFTASSSGTGTTISAVSAFNSSVTASASITMGRGSEVLFDFEDGIATRFNLFDGGYNYYLPNSEVSLATAQTGQVHSGNYSLALNVDYSNSFENGYQRIRLYYYGDTDGANKYGENVYLENATRLGMWIYVPDECDSLWARWINVAVTGVNSDGSYTIDGNYTGVTLDNITSNTGWVTTLEEPGWHYLSIDLSAYKGAVLRGTNAVMEFYICNNHDGQYDYKYTGASNLNGNFTFYIDDVTVDYSEAVDDREAPIFSELGYTASNMSDPAAIAKGSTPTVTSDSVSFTAKVAEDTSKDNASGLDVSTAKAYVDGNEVPCTYENGAIRMASAQTLTNGVHTVKFSICDNQGNYASIIRQINVQGGSAGVTVTAHDPSADRVPLGSVQYVDIVAPVGKEVQSLTVKLNLDSMNTWELDHMDVAAGYTAEWSMTGSDVADRIATVTITRISPEDVAEAGGTGLVLASIPVRIWNLDNPVYGTKAGTTGTLYTLKKFFSSGEAWPVAIDVRIQQGAAEYTDGTSDTFTGSNIFIWTECWAIKANMTTTAEGTAWWNNLVANGAHTHTSGNPTDKAPTCTEAGYSGRVFCTDCGSPVDWGVTVPATGHTWDFVDGKRACTDCGKLYTGEYDGKMYVDGGLIADGWDGDRYYKDGVMLTGIQIIDGKYYNFDEDGICTDKTNGHTGFFTQDDTKYYVEFGELKTGWFSVGTERYHAGEDGALHTVTTWDDRTCTTNGYIHYDCECGESELSEAMWSEGHTWDENHVCTVCGTQGIDIAGAELEFAGGTVFSYTGQAIRPAFKTIYDGKELNTRSDRLGEDGYITYTHNTEIGIATITIEGRGDYYGELEETFKIVPANVAALTAVQPDETSLTISWDKALGAGYYDLWQKTGNGSWEQIDGHLTGTSYTINGVVPGTYSFGITSLAEYNGETYRCTKWTYLEDVSVFTMTQISISETENGRVSTTPAGQALPNGVVTITTTPDEGYQARTVTVRTSKNTAVAVTKVSENTYTFIMPADDVTVSASFSAQGECSYLAGEGPFTAQLALTGLLSGRTYVCQMQKADADGNAIGCAAIVVFTATGSTQLLDVLPNSGGYLVSLWAYPSAGSIDDIGQLTIAFFGQHIKAESQRAFARSASAGAASPEAEPLPISTEGILDGLETVLGAAGAEPDGIEAILDSLETVLDDAEAGPDDVEAGLDDVEAGPDDVEVDPDDAEAGPDDVEAGPDNVEADPDGVETDPDDVVTDPDDISVKYLANEGPFTAQLELTGLLSGRTYVCQMQKADADGNAIGCAAIVVFTATDSSQLLDVLPNSGGYLVSLWAYPSSGSITDISQLNHVFSGQHIKSE